MGLIVSPETLVGSYNSKLRKIPKEHRLCKLFSFFTTRVCVCKFCNAKLIFGQTYYAKRLKDLRFIITASLSVLF